MRKERDNTHTHELLYPKQVKRKKGKKRKGRKKGKRRTKIK